MRTFFSLYSLKTPVYFVYMLQQVEYNPRKFLDWLETVFKDNQPLKSVMYRKNLTRTAKALLLLGYSYLLLVLLLLGAFFLADPDLSVWFYAAYIGSAIVIYPFLLELTLSVLALLAWVLLVRPAQKRQINKAATLYAQHKATKIAVIGSYGKTTMKELLHTILSEGMNVASTPGNKNTALSQARFVQSLKGDEEVLLVEFGEGQPGDVLSMTRVVKPDYAVVTGLAPNHLDAYPSLKVLAEDILSVVNEKNTKTYTSAESELLQKYAPKKAEKFSSKEVMGWKISQVVVSVTQSTFTMKKGKETLHITTGLLGRHQVAPIAFGAALAHELGLTAKQIEAGCAKVKPFEHRMQPRSLQGAWIIDDTYNGNIEGMVAGLKLLGELDFKRKMYVTPGLVDQGEETEQVHTKLGETIAAIQPDVVVLMDNSARPVIEKAMKKNKFAGELRIEKKPLEFYLNIEHQLAAGDLILMQNDWTDNYK